MLATKQPILMDVRLPEGVTLHKIVEETEQGPVINEVVFSVATDAPRKYAVIFEDEEVFDEKCRVLEVGQNPFTRVEGSTEQTYYDVVPVEFNARRAEPIPPKG